MAAVSGWDEIGQFVYLFSLVELNLTRHYHIHERKAYLFDYPWERPGLSYLSDCWTIFLWAIEIYIRVGDCCKESYRLDRFRLYTFDYRSGKVQLQHHYFNNNSETTESTHIKIRYRMSDRNVYLLSGMARGAVLYWLGTYAVLWIVSITIDLHRF